MTSNNVEDLYLISLFNLLIVCLVLNLELLKVNEVQSLGQFLFGLQLLFPLAQPVPELDVLQSHLLDLLLLLRLIEEVGLDVLLKRKVWCEAGKAGEQAFCVFCL